MISLWLLFYLHYFTLLSSLATQDLKKLRAQLYSAAEYFEYSYANDEKKELYVLHLSIFRLGFFYFVFVFSEIHLLKGCSFGIGYVGWWIP